MAPVAIRGSYVALPAASVTPELAAALGPERPGLALSGEASRRR
jgi:hypothetical protein